MRWVDPLLYRQRINLGTPRLPFFSIARAAATDHFPIRMREALIAVVSGSRR